MSLPDSSLPPPVCAAEWRLRAPDCGPLALLRPGRSKVGGYSINDENGYMNTYPPGLVFGLNVVMHGVTTSFH